MSESGPQPPDEEGIAEFQRWADECRSKNKTLLGDEAYDAIQAAMKNRYPTATQEDIDYFIAGGFHVFTYRTQEQLDASDE